MSDVQQLTKAYWFAAKKHKNQRRKGQAAEPYINHPAHVAHILSKAGASIDVMIAGVLHDTVEDTETTYEELVEEFGKKVADVVMEATDQKGLEKAERKRLQIEKMPTKSDDAKKVKIADKISNLKSMVLTPPDWPMDRKVEYFEWCRAVVDGGRGVCSFLEEEFDQAYQKGLKALEEQDG